MPILLYYLGEANKSLRLVSAMSTFVHLLQVSHLRRGDDRVFMILGFVCMVDNVQQGEGQKMGLCDC